MNKLRKQIAAMCKKRWSSVHHQCKSCRWQQQQIRIQQSLTLRIGEYSIVHNNLVIQQCSSLLCCALLLKCSKPAKRSSHSKRKVFISFPSDMFQVLTKAYEKNANPSGRYDNKWKENHLEMILGRSYFVIFVRVNRGRTSGAGVSSRLRCGDHPHMVCRQASDDRVHTEAIQTHEHTELCDDQL